MSNQQNDRRLRQVSGLQEVLARLMDQMQVRVQSSSRGEVLPLSTDVEGSSISENASPQFRAAPSRGDERRSSSFGNPPQSVDLATSGLNRLFLSPIISGVLRLFDQRSTPAPVPLERFSPFAGSLLERTASAGVNGETPAFRRDANGAAVSNGPTVTPVQISIQALDARSILERSSDIAQAVRQAMLSNHEINSDLGEL